MTSLVILIGMTRPVDDLALSRSRQAGSDVPAVRHARA